MLPATPDVIAVVHRRGGGRAGGAVDDRQRHARAADAVRARRASRQARRSWPDGLRRRRRGRRARHRAVPRARHADRRHGPADALPGDLPARGGGLPPGRGGAHDVRGHRRPRRGGDDRRPPRGLDRARCAWRSSGCSAGRWPACPADATAFAHRDEPDHGERRRALRASRRGARAHEAWVDEFAAALRQGDAGAYVELPRRRGRGAGPRRPTRGRPGTGWRRSRRATTRPTSSG